MTALVLTPRAQQYLAEILRIRAAMNAAGERCEGCGMALCRTCRDLYRMTRQHVNANGTCPNGHRVPDGTDKEQEG